MPRTLTDDISHLICLPCSPRDAFYCNVIFKVSTIFGIFPFRSVKERLKTDRLLVAYSFTVIGAFTLISIKKTLALTHNLYGNTFMKIIVCGGLSTNILSLPLFGIRIYLQQKAVEATFQDIRRTGNAFDKHIGKISNLNAITFSDIFVSLVFTFLICFLWNIRTGVFMGVLISVIILVSGQFSFLVSTVGSMFDAGMEYLIRIKEPSIEKTLRVVNAVNRLTSVSYRINSIYCLQIFYIMLVCYLTFIICLYFIFDSIGKSIGTKSIIGNYVVLIFHFYIIWKVNHSTAVTSKKVSIHFIISKVCIFKNILCYYSTRDFIFRYM